MGMHGGDYCVFNRKTKEIVLAGTNKTISKRKWKELGKSEFAVGISPRAKVGTSF